MGTFVDILRLHVGVAVLLDLAEHHVAIQTLDLGLVSIGSGCGGPFMKTFSRSRRCILRSGREHSGRTLGSRSWC